MAHATHVRTLAPPRSHIVGGLGLAFAVTALLITGCTERALPVLPSSNGATTQFRHDLVGQPSVRHLSIGSAHGLGGARTHAVSSGYYLLVARHSGKCLDVNGASLDDLASIIQWDCHEGDNQQWSVEPAGDGYYHIRARHSGKGLDVSGASLDDGAPVIQYAPHGGDNQQWRLVPVADGYYLVVARHSGKALDVVGASPDNGTPIIQYSVHSGENQQWLLRALDSLPTPPRDNYSGVYTLTITARSCSAGFPEAAKRRVYTAHVDQTGANLWVSLSGADFLPGSNTFTGAVEPTGEITFWIQPLSYWEYYGAELEERLSDGTVLMIFGTIDATSTPAGISGTPPAFSQESGLGGILHFPPRGSSGFPDDATGWCYIDRFEMVPR